MKLGELEMHLHTCKQCGATMKHYQKGGCNTPAEIECLSCTRPEELATHDSNGIYGADDDGD